MVETTNIPIKNTILDKIRIEAEKLGINEVKLANMYLSEAVEVKKTVHAADLFSDLVDIIKYDEPTNAIELRNQIRERKLWFSFDSI